MRGLAAGLEQGISLGISPINWINNDMADLGDNYTVETVLADMQQLGFCGTEWCRKFPTDVTALKPLLNTYGLTLAGAWITVQFSHMSDLLAEQAQYMAHARFLQAMQSDYVVVCDGGGSLHWDSQGPRAAVIPYDDTAWRQLADGLNWAGAYTRELGLRLAYHPHVGTNIEQPQAIDRLLELTDPDTVAIVYDTGHIYAGGGNPLAVLEKHFQRIACVHLKDVREEALQRFRQSGSSFIQAVRDGLFTTPGDGCIDFSSVISTLRQRAYRGWMMIEAEQDPELAEPVRYAEDAKQLLLSLMQDGK